MLKNIIALLIASVATILAASYLKPLLAYLWQLYEWLIHLLEQVFAQGMVGKTLNAMIPFFVIPIVIAGVVSLVYWMFKRSQFAYFNHIIWCIWIVLATLIIYHA